MLDWVSPESLFDNVAGLFEEKVILKNICERQTASVANTTNSQNFIIICLKELKFYFTTMCWTLQLAALLKTDSVIDVFVSWKFAANQQMNRTPSVLWNAIDQSCKQLLYQIQAPLSIINVKLFWNFDSDKRKMLFFNQLCTKFFAIAVVSPFCSVASIFVSSEVSFAKLWSEYS